MAKQFEYMVIQRGQGGKMTETEMTYQGKEGWELVSILGQSDLAGWTHAYFEYTFKRELTNKKTGKEAG